MPHRFPLYRFTALILSFAALVWFIRIWQRNAPVVQRYDLFSYLRTTLPEIPLLHDYTLVTRGNYLAVSNDTDGLRLSSGKYDRDKLRGYLQTNVYDGRSLVGVLRWPLAGFGFVLIVGMLAGGWMDRRGTQKARAGIVLRGPRMVSLRAWNRAIGWRDRGPAIRLTWGRTLRLTKSTLTQHTVIEGGTGSGKSQIARQFAYYFLQLGPVVFLDPKREYVSEFAGPDDWILDPGDERCPRWALEEESLDEMRATAPATAGFPDQPYTNPFWRKHPRFIISHILANRRPATKELAELLVGPNEIARLLKGTELKHSVTGEGDMQSGMLATLAELGRSLKFWPSEPERRSFSVSRWVKERRGNIFFTSSPDTLDALKPSQSMLLDMLILGMQKHPGPGALLLEEVAQAMDRLPKLESAVSLQRTAGNPIVLIFQEVAQLKEKYGELWSALVSQPLLHFVLRTREKQSAQHSSGLIGDHEVERLRESRSRGWFQWGRTTYSTERVTVPVVLPGEIQTLKSLRAFVALEDRVTKLRLKYQHPIIRAPRLIERIVKPAPAIEPEPPKPSRRYSQKALPLA